MKSTLHFYLMLIVLTNITFVQITEAVGFLWLAPMYALTLLSPMLTPLQARAWYRIGWNVAVLVIFAVLVADAMTTGIRFLLEDGLILAAFCQVHLLNVIRRQTGADLLFFNSFLIAIVTSLFCQDLVFSAVFALYAVVLVIGLHLHAFVRAPVPPDVALRRFVMREGGRRAFGVLVVTGFVFAFLPRDFRREGFVGDDLLDSVSSNGAGFSEEIKLGQTSISPVRRRIVMRIAVASTQGQDARTAVPELWRGATLDYFDKRGWRGQVLPQEMSLGPRDGNWQSGDSRVWRRSEEGTVHTTARVEVLPPLPPKLFMPLNASTLAFTRSSYAEPLADGTFRYNSGPPLHYDLELDEGGLGRAQAPIVNQYLQQTESAIPAALRHRLLNITEGLGPDPTQRQIVEACRDDLSRSFAYLLPGERGAARNLDEFVSGAGGGHCEYFATALAIMLRVSGIPCRVVTGFRVSEWDDEENVFVVRDAHAHAWVEVWSREAGWRAVDATPAADEEAVAESTWEMIKAQLEELWTSLIQFDSESRDAMLAWLATLPRELAEGAADHPWAALGVALAFAALGYRLRRRRLRRNRVADAARDYARVVSKLGLDREAGETPRELLVRVSDSDLAPESVEQLRAATREHERERYAGASLVEA